MESGVAPGDEGASAEDETKTSFAAGVSETATSASWDVVVLQDGHGSEPFTNWLHELKDRAAKQRILVRLAVVRRGSLGNSLGVGGGVMELKIDYAPGYRIYFGMKGNKLVVLIVGGIKAPSKPTLT